MKESERFLIDQMLMRLGRWLRLIGLDVANPPEGDDRQLLELALREKRTLVTRDKMLTDMCRRAGADFILIESSHLDDQLREILKSGINIEINPQRCTTCNGPLSPLNPEDALDPDLKKQISHLDGERPLWICRECRKVYWEGSHWKRIKDKLEEIWPCPTQ